jgi:glycerol-3-phosphate dehydrogenase subunit B
VKAVVVGGGLAGSSAALELASRGAEVTLVCAAPGATALSWGTLDVAAASPLRRGGLPLRDPASGRPLAPIGRVHAVAAANPAHPYATLLRERGPEDEVKEAVASLDAWLEPSGLRVHGSLAQTRWLADVHGALRAADLAFSGAGEGDLESADEIALVDVPGLPGFEVRSALRTLAAEMAAVGVASRALSIVRLVLPDALRDDAAQPARLARRLDTDAARSALRDAIASLGAEGRLLLFPPMLGLEPAAGTRAWIEATAGCRAAELVGAPSLSLAGFRLDRALGAALSRAGVECIAARVERVEIEGIRARGVRLAGRTAPGPPSHPAGRTAPGPPSHQAGRAAPGPPSHQAGRAAPGPPSHEEGTATLACDALVLATGRFVGGGIVERGGQLVEPLLGLPLHDLSGRRVDGLAARQLVRRDYEGEQPLFGTGVRTDMRLRPLGPDGLPRLANCFAAGDLLGCFDPARDRTGLGVALLSGRRAGIEAASC